MLSISYLTLTFDSNLPNMNIIHNIFKIINFTKLYNLFIKLQVIFVICCHLNTDCYAKLNRSLCNEP